MEYIRTLIQLGDKKKIYPDIPVIDGGADPEVVVDGKKLLMFSSNNYLGLTSHPKIKAAAHEAIEKYGTGSGGSRLLSGNLKIHEEAEQKVASFKGGEAAIIFPTGYSANLGAISGFLNLLNISLRNFFMRKGMVFSDDLNHASIIDGCRLSGAKTVVYPHKDMNALESKLKRYRYRRKLVITDGVFSMDGDIAPLDQIAYLAKKYDAVTMVDEAHATGILGVNGRGTVEHFHLKPMKDIDIIMGTFSKSVGAVGGYVVGSMDLIRYLRVAARSYMFSAAMSPVTAATIIAAIDLMESDQTLRTRLWENTNNLKEGFKRLGFNTFSSETQIIPILIGKDDKGVEFSRRLFNYGIYGPCVRWPAVTRNQSRIRFTVMASHTKEQIDYLLNCCESLRDTMNLVKKSFLLNPVTSFRRKQGRTYVKMGVGGNRESVQEKILT
jgi:8-amino-7-oxononanoate synthase